jgi:membrane protein
MLRNLSRALGRVFPNCITLGQAIAFNMFLAFFPLLLLAIGLLGETSFFRDALREIPRHLVMILPPGTSDVVSAYFVRPVLHPWRWILLGTGGTLLGGTQVMVGYMEGFRLIEGDLFRPTYLKRQLRALGLVCLTIFPMLTVVVLSVFGKSVRAWITLRIAMPPYVTHEVWIVLYISFTLLLAMVTLVVLYRLGRPEHPGYRSLVPGAAVATVLWWAADVVFGWYVRVMPYTTVYRGLAAAIGLLLWMFFTALIVLLGAAYNAEYRESRVPAAVPARVIPEDTPNAYGGASAKSAD